MNGLNGTVAAIALVVGTFAFSPARAALVTCPEPGFTTEPNAKVENSTGLTSATSKCQYITPADNSNVASIANIDAAGFFGFTDWATNGQTQIDAGSALTGTWSIGSVNFASYDYIIVFKDGAGTNLTAFLFNEQYASGVWSTPFTDPPFDLPGASTSHGVSHYTIAKRYDPTPSVPEPVSLVLLGSGLIGLGFVRRFGRRKACLRLLT